MITRELLPVFGGRENISISKHFHYLNTSKYWKHPIELEQDRWTDDRAWLNKYTELEVSVTASMRQANTLMTGRKQ